MNFSKSELRQINDSYIDSFSDLGELSQLTKRLTEDLKVTTERLDQNPANSSRPSGSMPPWERNNNPNPEDQSEELNEDESEITENENSSNKSTITPDESDDKPPADPPPIPPKRKPGRQPGTKGHARSENFPTDRTVEHRPKCCNGCKKPFDGDAESIGICGNLRLDIERGDNESRPGIQLIQEKHVYYKSICAHCGFETSCTPHSIGTNGDWNVKISEQHFVGPMLLTLIVYLSYSMRLSRKKVKQLLADWLKVDLSTSTINKCVHEAARCLEPLEDELQKEVNEAHQLYVDETPWWERSRKNMYLWVFVSLYTCYFCIGRRTKDELRRTLPVEYAGQLMSDGYSVYREYKNRGRCWDHLRRKAVGLSESLNKEAQVFGEKTLFFLKTFREAIYKAREGPPGENLKKKFEEDLFLFKYMCIKYDDHSHEKTASLARELLYDWNAIFSILDNPHLPLTNNEAERMLRHWVIYRRICQGTQTEQGSRCVAILASITETCKLRKSDYIEFVAKAIECRRSGKELPSLPSIPEMNIEDVA